MKNRWLFALVSLLACGLTAAPAAADISARYELQDSQPSFDMTMTLEIDAGGNERIQMTQQAGYMLVLNEVTYLVARGPTGVYVARLDDLVTVMGEAAKRMGFADALANMPKSDQEKPPVLASMGSKLINGRAGTAYGISDKRARPVFALFVISSDPKLAPLGAAFVKSFAQSSSYANKMFPGLGTLTQMFGPNIEVLGKGAPLSMLSMNLTDVSFAEIDDSRFTLPAKPLTIDEIRQQYENFPTPPTLPSRDK